MESEEKKHDQRKKFVTEEVTEKVPEQVQDEKSAFMVTPTNNIDFSSKKEERGAFIKIFLVTFFATLLAFLLAGGIYVYLTGGKALGSRQLDTSKTQAPVGTPLEGLMNQTPTPQPNLDLTAYKISVLNGNGGIGVASGAKAVIEKAGFKVTNTGNADSFDFTDTLIQVKSSVPAQAVSALKTALDANYSTKIGDPLDSASIYDIVVTVGSK